MSTEVHQVSFVQPGRGCSWSATFQIFDMPTRSGDIRDQSRKLSEIEPKIGRFFTFRNFTGRNFQKLYALYQPCLRTRRLEKTHQDINTNSEVIGVHTLNLKANFKFSRLYFFWWGGGVPLRVCAIKAWSISSACKNLRAQHSLRAEILCPEKCPLGWVNMHLYNFLVCGPKFTRFLLSNLGLVVVDQLLFRFFICLPVSEIFAIKVESCQKSLQNLDVFLTLPNFRGRAFQKLCARYYPCLATRRLEKFQEDIPTSPEVIGVHTLNFRPDY